MLAPVVSTRTPFTDQRRRHSRRRDHRLHVPPVQWPSQGADVWRLVRRFARHNRDAAALDQNTRATPVLLGERPVPWLVTTRPTSFDCLVIVFLWGACISFCALFGWITTSPHSCASYESSCVFDMIVIYLRWRFKLSAGCHLIKQIFDFEDDLLRISHIE